MNFYFQSQQYRLAFFHDKPKDPQSHKDHVIKFVTEPPEGRKPPKLTVRCILCDVRLWPLKKRERERQTHCKIYRIEPKLVLPDEKVVVAEGSGLLKAGDQFNREQGRLAALGKALEDMTSKEFREAAWKAYLQRFQVLPVERVRENQG